MTFGYLHSEVSQLDGALKNRPPEIVVTAIGADAVELNVVVWISNIYTEVNLKSQFLQRLLTAFKAASIKLIQYFCQEKTP